MNSNEQTKDLRPSDLVNQLFDAVLLQYKSEPREAAKVVVVFLTEALVYAVSAVAGDETARQAALKGVCEMITAAGNPPPAKP